MALAVVFGMMNETTQKKTDSKQSRTPGLVIAGASLLLLFGVAFLKGRVK